MDFNTEKALELLMKNIDSIPVSWLLYSLIESPIFFIQWLHIQGPSLHWTQVVFPLNDFVFHKKLQSPKEKTTWVLYIDVLK